MDKVHEYKAKIEVRLARYPQIVDLEKQTGVDKFYIFCVAAVLTGILLFVVGGTELIVALVGFIYPAYQSFKAITTPNPDDDTLWLTYWVVFAFFTITESVTDLILSWIPFYFFLKVAFLVWCYHPQTVGSLVIYNTLIKPYIAPHVGSIDAAVNSIDRSFNSLDAAAAGKPVPVETKKIN